MSPDPLGPRKLTGPGANIVLGALVVVVGLVLALSNGGRVWLLPLIGAVLIGVCLAELYLDPVDRPHRGALRQHRQRRPWLLLVALVGGLGWGQVAVGACWVLIDLAIGAGH